MLNLIDSLNNRDFDVNTVEGASQTLHHFLKGNPQRIAHSVGVAGRTTFLCKYLGVPPEIGVKAVQAALLHDIGYSNLLNKAGFHPFDGANYLKLNDWSSAVYKTALYHSYAKEYVDQIRPELTNVYTKQPNLTPEEDFIIKLVTWADLTIDADGNEVTFEDRLNGVATRYGVDSTQYKHMKSIEEQLTKDVETVKTYKTTQPTTVYVAIQDTNNQITALFADFNKERAQEMLDIKRVFSLEPDSYTLSEVTLTDKGYDLPIGKGVERDE